MADVRPVKLQDGDLPLDSVGGHRPQVPGRVLHKVNPPGNPPGNPREVLVNFTDGSRDPILSCSCHNDIPTRLTGNPVIAVATKQDVLAAVAVQVVMSRDPRQGIVSTMIIQSLIPISTRQYIVAGTSEQSVTTTLSAACVVMHAVTGRG